MLLITGCSSSEEIGSKNLSSQSSSSLKGQSNSILKGHEKSITDSDLLNADQKDSSDNMDSLDIQVPQQLSSDDMNALLNDDSSLKSIPANINLK